MFVMVIGLLVALCVAIPVILAVLAILGAVFSGIAVLLVAGVFAGSGILPGMILGFIAYRVFRKARIAERKE